MTKRQTLAETPGPLLYPAVERGEARRGARPLLPAAGAGVRDVAGSGPMGV